MTVDGQAFAIFPTVETEILHSGYADSLPQISAPSAADNHNRNPAVRYQPSQNLTRSVSKLNVLWTVAERRERAIEIQQEQNGLCSSNKERHLGPASK